MVYKQMNHNHKTLALKEHTKRPKESSSSYLELENILRLLLILVIKWWTIIWYFAVVVAKDTKFPDFINNSKKILSCPISTVAMEQIFLHVVIFWKIKTKSIFFKNPNIAWWLDLGCKKTTRNEIELRTRRFWYRRNYYCMN